MTTRESLHALIDELPEEALALAEARLRGLDTHDPAGIPYDDEPYTEEDLARWAAIEAAHEPTQALTTDQVIALLRAP